MNSPTEYISLIVPSRARAKRLREMLSSVETTTSGKYRIEVIIVLDSDDQQDYPRENLTDIECTYIIGAPGRPMGVLNMEAVRTAKGNTIFLCNDDVRFETNGWDQIVMSEVRRFDDGLYLIYPNDGIKGKRLATFPILSRNLLLNNADLLPSSYKGSFIDLHIMDVFMELKQGYGIVYLDNVMCRHLHFSEDPNLFDSTYGRRDRFGDDSRFLEYSKRRKVLAGFLEKVPIKPIAFESSIVGLLHGRSTLTWRLRLFVYMFTRTLYRKIFVSES